MISHALRELVEEQTQYINIAFQYMYIHISLKLTKDILYVFALSQLNYMSNPWQFLKTGFIMWTQINKLLQTSKAQCYLKVSPASALKALYFVHTVYFYFV
jgi:hypothetical protein